MPDKPTVEEIVSAVVAMTPENRVLMLEALTLTICQYCWHDLPADGVCHCTNDE